MSIFTNLFHETGFQIFLGFAAIMVELFIILAVLNYCGVCHPIEDDRVTLQETQKEKKTGAAKDKNPYKPLEETEAAKDKNPYEPSEYPSWKASHAAYWEPNITYPPQQQYAGFAASNISAPPVIAYPTMAQPVTAVSVNLLPRHPPYPIYPKAAQDTLPTAPPFY